MDICVFAKYKVKRKGNYSYISDKIGYGWDSEYVFSDDKIEDEQIIEGSKLMKLIGNSLIDRDTIVASFTDESESKFKISFEDFNPNTGEGGNLELEIELIKEDTGNDKQ